jgi:hypothetical protein
MENNKLESISEYQQYFESLYGKLNQDKNWFEIYGFLSRTSGYLTRSILRKSVKSQDFARSISWLFALASKLDVSLETSFYKKFPGICPYCIERTCCCFRTNKAPLKYRPPHKLIEERRVQFDIVKRRENKDLDSALENISDIYPNNEVVWHFAGPWMNCAKLFEEIAELHEAICKYKSGEKSKDNVEDEFADVFAWILSAWVSSNKNKSLDDEFISYFYKGCPVCKSLPCSCAENSSRIQGLVDVEKFKELRVLFEELEVLSPNAKDDLSELITSLKSVESNQDEIVASATVQEAKSKADTLKNTLEQTEDVSKKLASIGKSIMSLVSFFS